MLEDIGLWGVLSIASALAASKLGVDQQETRWPAPSASTSSSTPPTSFSPSSSCPPVLRKISRAGWNVLAQNSGVAWMLTVFLGYVALAAALDVTLAFAALLAGYGVMGGIKSTEHPPVPGAVAVDQRRRRVLLRAGVLRPHRLPARPVEDLRPRHGGGVHAGHVGRRVPLRGPRLPPAGMNWLDTMNLAVTQNARGGPGIVMASVAFDAGIINAPFFTTLVLTAVLTSQACGFWLQHVLAKGWPLLSGDDLRRRGLEPEAEAALLSTPLRKLSKFP